MGRLRQGGISVRACCASADLIREDLHPASTVPGAGRNSSGYPFPFNQPVSADRGVRGPAIRELAFQLWPTDHVVRTNRGRAHAVEHQLAGHSYVSNRSHDALNRAVDFEIIRTGVD